MQKRIGAVIGFVVVILPAILFAGACVAGLVGWLMWG